MVCIEGKGRLVISSFVFGNTLVDGEEFFWEIRVLVIGFGSASDICSFLSFLWLGRGGGNIYEESFKEGYFIGEEIFFWGIGKIIFSEGVLMF